MSEQPNIPGVDFDHTLPVMDREQIDMLMMVDDDEDPTALVRELFELFQQESTEKLNTLEAACAANNAQDLRKIVHFIAGSAGNLGLARLCGFYRGVEQGIETGRLPELSHCAAPIRDAFDGACAAFRDEFSV